MNANIYITHSLLFILSLINSPSLYNIICSPKDAGYSVSKIAITNTKPWSWKKIWMALKNCHSKRIHSINQLSHIILSKRYLPVIDSNMLNAPLTAPTKICPMTPTNSCSSRRSWKSRGRLMPSTSPYPKSARSTKAKSRHCKTSRKRWTPSSIRDNSEMKIERSESIVYIFDGNNCRYI